MKIGMSLTSSYPTSLDSRVIMENLVEEVKLMAQLGFDSLSLGDHHLTPNHYVQVLPAISSLSSISGNMQLLPLFLLPFYNPILLAEQLATLDVISGGRITVINALGYDAAAFTAFQTTQRARVSRFIETFEIMRLLWERDAVTYKGRHYSFDAPISLNPKPVSRPLLMWIAGGAEPAIQRAARLGDGWAIVPGWTPDLVKKGIQFYRDSLA
ncbi:MAG: LLM class flavin-dependent oxidoreductase, partial [Chloroflexi bacterium]|nr:LLM class flavin-dependent oxidoreductase [Chloroflexota bacterium]